MSNLRTALLFPTEPWIAAKDKFLEGLSQEENQYFKDATLENIFYAASSSQKKHARGSRSWVMQERIKSLVEGIEDYGRALDVYSNAHGLVLCPIWGSIRVVLHIAHEAGKFQEKLVDMFSSIGDVLPRFRIYEGLFRNHERLLRVVSSAYLDILQFCIKAKQFFSHAKRTPIPASVICMGIWKPFRQGFDTYIVDFRKHRKQVEKEASTAHMIESARHHEIERANRELQKHNDKLNKRHRLLSSLQTVDYQSKHRMIVDLLHPGTSTWLQTHPDYVAWRTSNNSDCLCCFGIPGSGKSVLASSVVDTLDQATSDPTTMLCYYYFDYADARSLDLVQFFGSLTKQVLVRLPLDDFGEKWDYPIEGYASNSLEHTINLFERLFRNFPNTFIVLDGLDELSGDGQSATLKFLLHFLQPNQPIVKAFVTSRAEEHLVRKRLQPYRSFELSPASTSGDISLFVDGALKSAAQECPELGDSQLRQEVTDALVKGANGM